ncbi:MAG TPA: hypothetical protein VKA92_04915 [Segetibacter sp.]|nr:hypothetical protein [Segetibacter sp.]
MNRKLFAVLFIIFPITTIFGQTTKSTDDVRQIWFGYFNQARLSDRWGLWGDCHLRTKEDFTDNLSQLIIRRV